ncbi:MAG: hypothetical protein L0Y72_07910 [Gemmataceae bacterium]|nr:hypothetical protein [Gemmataceae bacterium]
MSIQNHLAYFVLCAVALAGAATPTHAADGEPDRWHLISTPFLWGSALEGDATIRGVDLNIDLGFDDLFEVTDFGFQTYLEVRKKKFGFFAAPSYLKLSGDAEAGSLSADFEQQWWTVEGGGFYNLVDTGNEKPFTLDVIAGVRYWNVDTEVNVEGGGPLGVDLEIGSTFEILDPIVGLRMRYYFTRKLSISLRGDVGGFGISSGDTSEFSWQALGLLGYDFTKRFTLLGGYRALGIDAEEDSGNTFDVVFQGVLLGLQIRW